MSTVLVTGGSGFIGSHCILRLLAGGDDVRATVRDLKRESDVRAMLRQGGADPGNRLAFFAADLENDAGWNEAVAGCDYVLHVASPLPPFVPKDENELIVPAREGALRVLRAARDAGVKRVVLTSSFAAIGYGHPPRQQPFTEADWTDLNAGDILPYTKSKTLAERAAWDFIKRVGGIPGCPRYYIGVVDVRDVADLHLRAMRDSAAKGERFLATAGDVMSIADIANVLVRRMGAAARRAPTRELPNWLVHLAALVQPAVRQILPELGKAKNSTGEKARRVLGWSPRSREEAIVATAESLLQLGLLKDRTRKAA